MTRGGLAMTTVKTLLLRKSGTGIISPKTLVGRCMSKVATRDECCYEYDDGDHVNEAGDHEVQAMKHKVQREERDEGGGWIPHARTGIYYPQGHEWVMDDVPDGAARFAYSYWFRNTDS